MCSKNVFKFAGTNQKYFRRILVSGFFLIFFVTRDTGEQKSFCSQKVSIPIRARIIFYTF